MAKQNWFSSLAPYIAGAVGSGVANNFSALAPFSAAIGAGAGALTNSNNRLAGAAQGFAGGGVGSALEGGVKGAFGGNGGNFGGGVMNGLQTYGNSIPGFGGVGTSNPTGALAKFFSGGNSITDPTSSVAGANSSPNFSPLSLNNNGLGNLSMGSPTMAGGTMSPMPSFGGSSITPSASTAAVNSPSAGGGFGANSGNTASGPMSMFKSLLPGAAVSLGGSLLAPQVKAPDYSGVMSQFQTQMQNGGDPAALNAARNQYLSTLNTPNGASAEGAVANANLINERQKAAANKAITEQFSANNGSTTGNSAYNDAITKSNAAYDANYQAQAQQAQFQADQLQAQQKQAAAQALSGMNDTQMQYYAGLAGLSIQQIQEKTGMDVASANAVKNIATTAGQLLMEKGLGLNNAGGGK